MLSKKLFSYECSFYVCFKVGKSLDTNLVLVSVPPNSMPSSPKAFDRGANYSGLGMTGLPVFLQMGNFGFHVECF